MDAIQPAQVMTDADRTLHKKTILFPNGKAASLVTTTANAPAIDILNTLGIQRPKALLLVIGGADGLDDSLKARLRHLCSRGIARVAAGAEAAIIDGGTQAGIMEMMGQGVADRGHQTMLLGVAPSGMVTYPGQPPDGSLAQAAPLDPNHSHFVLVAGSDWGDETSMMYKLADDLSKNVPTVTVLANGGQVVKREALHTIQRGWPLLVIKGSDRAADEIATLWEEKDKNKFIPDPELAEIVEKGNIHLFPIDGKIEEFEEVLKLLLYRSDVLTHAWELFALYDDNAKRQRDNFYNLQRGILLMGVLATAAVVIQALLRVRNILVAGTPWDWIVHAIAVLLPIVVSVLIAGASRFTPGNKWVLLRASAEAIKREIYCYRTETGDYAKVSTASPHRSSKGKPELSPQEQFTEKIADISRQLLQTEINVAGLRPYTDSIPPKMDGAAGEDDGYTKLTPERYISIRIGDQLSYFQSKSAKLAKEMAIYYWLIFIVGGLGTLLAALGVEPFVALTAALAAAFASYLEYRQIEYTLIKYNQTAANLRNAIHLWVGLSEDKRAKNFGQLVSSTEQISETENVGWVQQMHDALAKLRASQEKDTENQNQQTDNQGNAGPT